MFTVYLLSFLASISDAAPIDWAQPPVGCVEELAPKASEDRSIKIEEVYRATETQGIPPQILFGALMAESAFKNLGITADGGNYSCGIGQINVREWCFWANTLGNQARTEISWPTANVNCAEEFLPALTVKPFYDIAKKRGGDAYNDISFESVKTGVTNAAAPVVTDGTETPPVITVTPEVAAARFMAASSFTRFCRETRSNIRAKAVALRKLFDEEVPAPLRSREFYGVGEGFKRHCIHSSGNAYPLHTGWLMAVAMYNAGKKFLPRLASFYGMTKNSILTDAAWDGFDPEKLVEGLYGGGKYNLETKELNYYDLEGNPIEASWYKACIAQRHVANVVQFSSRPGVTIVRSLERPGTCSQVTPNTRQATSGFLERP
jgi:hypothetical protein